MADRHVDDDNERIILSGGFCQLDAHFFAPQKSRRRHHIRGDVFHEMTLTCVLPVP